MDQTSFSLLAGLVVGLHLGAFLLRSIAGWNLWICYLTGGLVGFFVVSAATMALIQWIARRGTDSDDAGDR